MSYLVNPYKVSAAGYPDSLLTDANGTVNSATIVTGAKLGDNFVNFTASSASVGQSINIPDNTALDWSTGGSIAFWVNPTELTDRRLLAKGSNSGWEALSETTNNKIRWRIKEASGGLITIESTTALSDSTWYHVVGVYDNSGDESRLYINSVEENQSAISVSGIATNTSDVYLGSNSTPAQYFSGKLDDIGIFNYAISQATIDDLYNSGTGALVSSLSDYTGILAYYSCEEFTDSDATLPNDATP
jgi:hypothetical protein